MLACVVISRNLPGREHLPAALAASGATVVHASARARGEPDILADMREAARAGADLLVADAEAGPAAALAEAVRAWRIARPRGRVLLLAPGREPPDAAVSRLVDLGVYDILADEPPDGDWAPLLPAVLARPATYADAARWHLSPPAPAGAGGRAAVLIECVHAGTVIVPVLAAPGTGATLAALLAADHLARQGRRVAVVQACPSPALPCAPDPAKGYATAGRVHLYAPAPGAPDPVGEGVALLRRLHGAGRYQYIVADFGSALAVEDVRDEIVRAGMCLVVVSPAAWRREGTLPLVAAAAGLAARVRVLVSPAGDPGGRDVRWAVPCRWQTRGPAGSSVTARHPRLRTVKRKGDTRPGAAPCLGPDRTCAPSGPALVARPQPPRLGRSVPRPLLRALAFRRRHGRLALHPSASRRALPAARTSRLPLSQPPRPSRTFLRRAPRFLPGALRHVLNHRSGAASGKGRPWP